MTSVSFLIGKMGTIIVRVFTLLWGLNENFGHFSYVQASIHSWTLRDAVSLVHLLTLFSAQRLNSSAAHPIPRYLQLPPDLMRPQNMNGLVEVHLPLCEKEPETEVLLIG